MQKYSKQDAYTYGNHFIFDTIFHDCRFIKFAIKTSFTYNNEMIMTNLKSTFISVDSYIINN